MATTPPTITPAPPAPQRNNRSTFSDLVDAFVLWLVNAVTQFNAVASNVFGNATDAYNAAASAAISETNAAASAATSVSASNATAFVAGTNYPQYKVVWSPIDLLTYRRKTAGSSTIDPSLDPANWQVISGLNLAQLHAAALYF